MAAVSIRRVAEIVLGPIVIRRHLPVESGNGVIFVSGRVGGLRYLLKPSKQWDPELLRIAQMLVMKGGIVWDVGANVGPFSKAAAFHAGPSGRVLSIEADTDAVALLNLTCRAQASGHAPITILPVAANDTSGFVRLSIAKRARSANFIDGFGSTQTGGVAETRTIPCVSLDDLLEQFPAPDVIKIDVEGAESKVLRGGERLLRDKRPLIHCEVSSEASATVTELLSRYSYRLWDASSLVRHVRAETQTATYNTVAIPSERVEEFLGSL